jgi:ankyrin repeat protein
MKSNEDMVALLVEMNCPIEYTLHDGTMWSPLYDAVRLRNCSLVHLLVSLGADMEVSTPNNSTPFHLSCIVEHLDVMKGLAAAGANLEPSHPATGRTPMQDLVLLNRPRTFSPPPATDVLQHLLVERREQERSSQETLARAISMLELPPRIDPAIVSKICSYVPMYLYTGSSDSRSAQVMINK